MGQKRIWRGPLLLVVPLFLLFFLARPSASSEKENLDLPFDAIGETEEEELAPEIVVFYGAVYEADGLFFALDESGSMDYQGRWELQTREILRTISEMSDRAEFGVVFYATGVSAFRDAPVTATEGSKQAAKAWVQSRHPQGDTCLAEGTVRALQIAAKSKAKHRSVIVTSDGKPDICSTGQGATGDQLGGLIQKTLQANPGRRIKVHTIWVGEVNDPVPMEFMKRLATAHGGTFRAVSR
jgi:Mg-chelatase subunit ChlD